MHLFNAFVFVVGLASAAGFLASTSGHSCFALVYHPLASSNVSSRLLDRTKDRILSGWLAGRLCLGILHFLHCIGFGLVASLVSQGRGDCTLHILKGSILARICTMRA